MRSIRITSTLRQVGVPMILTTVSTAAGFLSLLFTDVRPIGQLGTFTAIGIAFAGIISFFSLPALLSRVHVEPKHHTALLGPRLTAVVKQLAMRRWVAVLLAGGLIVFSAVSIPQLEVDGDQLIYFKDDDPVRLGFEKQPSCSVGQLPSSANSHSIGPAVSPVSLRCRIYRETWNNCRGFARSSASQTCRELSPMRSCWEP